MRIFDYVNISNERSIWADSGFHVQRNIITEILKKRNDYHFFLVVPFEQLANARFTHSELLTLMPYHYSTGSGNKYHFNTNELWKLLDTWHKDYDLMLNNEIILGTHFRNLLLYKSHFDIPIINYIHWVNTMDVKGNPKEGITPQQFDMFNSIYWSYNTYCNSEYGKSLALKNVDRIYNKETAEMIANKLHPLPVGFNDQELLEQKTTQKFDKVTLLFNHRISEYTGYNVLLKKCKEIWEGGNHNFQLIFTNPSVSVTRQDLSKFPFLKLLDKVPTYKEYLKLLWMSDICFGLHTGANQWSIAVMEAIFCNNIPITSNDIFYKEMLKEKTNTIDELGWVIENINSIQRVNHNLERYYWRNLVDEYIKVFEQNVAQHAEEYKLQKPEKSQMLQEVISLFNQRPIIDKQEILRIRGKMKGSGIGLQVPYSRYRRELLKICDDDITKENACYKLKDTSKVNVKPIDEWLI